MIINMVSAFRISRTSPSWLSDHLSPFAMCAALPRSDYYEDSVTIGLASLRRSRVPLRLNVKRNLGAPFIPFNELAVHGDRKKPGELCGSRLILGLRIESRIPLLELASEIFIQHLCPYLQEQMGAATTPAHLLFFDEPFA